MCLFLERTPIALGQTKLNSIIFIAKNQRDSTKESLFVGVLCSLGRCVTGDPVGIDLSGCARFGVRAFNRRFVLQNPRHRDVWNFLGCGANVAPIQIEFNRASRPLDHRSVPAISPFSATTERFTTGVHEGINSRAVVVFWEVDFVAAIINKCALLKPSSARTIRNRST